MLRLQEVDRPALARRRPDGQHQPAAGDAYLHDGRQQISIRVQPGNRGRGRRGLEEAIAFVVLDLQAAHLGRDLRPESGEPQRGGPLRQRPGARQLHAQLSGQGLQPGVGRRRDLADEDGAAGPEVAQHVRAADGGPGIRRDGDQRPLLGGRAPEDRWPVTSSQVDAEMSRRQAEGRPGGRAEEPRGSGPGSRGFRAG